MPKTVFCNFFKEIRASNLVTVSISLSVPLPSSGCSASSTLSSMVCADSRELKRTAVNSSLLRLLSSACNPKPLNSASSYSVTVGQEINCTCFISWDWQRKANTSSISWKWSLKIETWSKWCPSSTLMQNILSLLLSSRLSLQLVICPVPGLKVH